MMKLSRSILLAILASLALACVAAPVKHAAPPKTVTVTESDSGKVALHAGDRLVVRLAANASTGYQWKLVDKSPKVLRPAGDPGYEPIGKPKPGSGGVAIYKFTAIKPGNAVLVFTYARSWEHKAPAKTVTYKVHIAKAGSK
jgi:inhibitor of cysteine peptidase